MLYPPEKTSVLNENVAPWSEFESNKYKMLVRSALITAKNNILAEENKTLGCVTKKKVKKDFSKNGEGLPPVLFIYGDAFVFVYKESIIIVIVPPSQPHAGWYRLKEAGSLLGVVFRSVNNNSGVHFLEPYKKKLHSGRMTGMSVNAALIGRDGRVCTAGSAEPVIDETGEILGVLLMDKTTKNLETRDFITRGHSDRLHWIIGDVAFDMGLSKKTAARLLLFAQYHDIGKVGISDSILSKPGPLSNDEYSIIRQHCDIGYRVALKVPVLSPIADWILMHHEWWNGEGYPLKKNGADIPLECRILSIADAYDAMTSDRPYRKALPKEKATAELRRCAGTQFDPELVTIFIKSLEKR